jgi:hypothetical protein
MIAYNARHNLYVLSMEFAEYLIEISADTRDEMLLAIRSFIREECE